MAVNKNFVVKNGLEVNEQLIVANASDSMVGVGTSTPAYTLHVFGGIGATDVRVSGASSFYQDVRIGSAGTTFSVIDSSGNEPRVGVGTDVPAYLVDIQSPVSAGYTALYVKGDARITGDLIADDISLDQAEFTNINVTGYTTTGQLQVGSGVSIAGITTLGYLGYGATALTVGAGDTHVVLVGDLYVGGDLTIRDDVALDTNLFIVGIATIGTIHVGTAFTVAGISTFTGNVNIGAAASLDVDGFTELDDVNISGACTVGGDLDVTGGISLSGDITVDELTARNLDVSGIGTIHTLGVTSTLTTTDLAVGAAATITGIGSFGSSVNVVGAGFVGGDLTVGGDLNVTGDISYDEVTGRNLNITGIGTIHTLGVTSTTTTTDLAVGAAATVSGRLTAQDVLVSNASTITGNLSVGGDLNVTGDIVYDEVTGRNLDITGIATIHTLGVTSTTTLNDLSVGAAATITGNLNVSGNTVLSGVVTATSFDGIGQIGIGSESTAIGSGVTFIDFTSSTGTAIAMDPPTSGIATVQFTPGVSIGLAIALGS